MSCKTCGEKLKEPLNNSSGIVTINIPDKVGNPVIPGDVVLFAEKNGLTMGILNETGGQIWPLSSGSSVNVHSNAIIKIDDKFLSPEQKEQVDKLRNAYRSMVPFTHPVLKKLFGELIKIGNHYEKDFSSLNFDKSYPEYYSPKTISGNKGRLHDYYVKDSIYQIIATDDVDRQYIDDFLKKNKMKIEWDEVIDTSIRYGNKSGQMENRDVHYFKGKVSFIDDSPKTAVMNRQIVLSALNSGQINKAWELFAEQPEKRTLDDIPDALGKISKEYWYYDYNEFDPINFERLSDAIDELKDIEEQKKIKRYLIENNIGAVFMQKG